MPYPTIDLSRVQTYPLPQRPNLVDIENLIQPEQPAPPFDSPDLNEVIARIVTARRNGRPLIWMMGAHVVKRGLAPVLIDLMERGVITHLAGNGATTIHDFEIALQGHTSEDVATSLEDGRFGMAHETGTYMNTAIRQGARDGIGMGEALGRFIDEDDRFRYRQYGLLHSAYRLGIPYTVHVAVGTDIIHQHPGADFSAIGWASGQDFKIFCASVSQLEGGVFCNFGSSVIGPEVFLKALSIVRNLGHTVKVFTTANFDLIPLGDYRRPVKDDIPDYYYRPRKNIVNRPVSMGGKGFHIVGDHAITIPTLHHQIVASLDRVPVIDQRRPLPVAEPKVSEGLAVEAPRAAQVLQESIEQAPRLAAAAEPLVQSFNLLWHSFRASGTLFLAGNGGSMADAIHISGELVKAFKLPRPIPERHRQRLANLSAGPELADNLQQGVRAIPLGINLSLRSAIENDIPVAGIELAQELYVLARPGDVLLGISTSGNARNVNYAAGVAKAMGLYVIGLTGAKGGQLAAQADVTIKAPPGDTAVAQEFHIQVYHTLCAMLEAQLYGGENA